jgi:acetyl-CoA synthetase
MGERSWRSFVEEIRHGGERPFSEHWLRFQECYRTRAPGARPPIAWWPNPETRGASNLFSFMRELGLDSRRELHRFSVQDLEAFWSRVLARLGIVFETEPERMVDVSRGVTNPQWLPGASLDITESCFRSDRDKAAIIFRREGSDTLESMSYGALERQVDRFASGLLLRGFVPDDAVALYMPMTPECVVAYLGTIRAGCRAVSVADSFSADELRSRMVIAHARTVVTVSRYRRGGRDVALYPKVRQALEGLDGNPRAVVVEPELLEGEDLDWDDFLASNETAPSYVAPPEHVINILFSSGTTGTPKAIPWTATTPLKCAMDAHFHQDVHPDDVVAWPTNVGWMMGPWLIFGSLLNRAAMALYGGAPAGRGYTRFVDDARVSVLGVVPSMVRKWRADESVGFDEWKGVRLFSSTGEASSAEDYLWLMSRSGYRAPSIEYLGGTEIGGGHMTGTVLDPCAPATFTTPALGVDFVVLDERGTEVTEGGVGELFLVPPALGMSDRLLNADHDEIYFAGCPSGPRGQALRRHGDEVQVLPEGYFKACGRSDDAMNLGGIKVGSLELERVVNDHPAVFESAAVGVAVGGEGAERLVLHVVLREDIETEQLKKELSRAIAERMNPLFAVHDVVVVDALPRTASNKIMRRELRASRGGAS